MMGVKYDSGKDRSTSALYSLILDGRRLLNDRMSSPVKNRYIR
jgi:hypothetical protein